MISLFVLGIGVSVLYPALFEFVSRNFPPSMAGTIIGLWMGLGNLGGGTGLFLDGALLNRARNYSLAILAVALAAAAGFILSCWLKKSGKVEAAEPAKPG